MIRRLLAAAIVCLCAPAARAAGEYLPEKDVLWVKDYPAEFPCTPQLLARIDRTFGWGKVAYDEASDTCTVSCSLWIGRNDGTNTYFQVGSPTHPQQTLIVNGDVRVYSTWLAGENIAMPYHRIRARGRVNRLTLGVKGQPAINAQLLIDNRSRAGHTLIIGGFSGYSTKNFGGQLCVYNGTIAPFGGALIGDARRPQPVHCGGQDRLELINATIRGVRGRACGRNLARARVERCLFDHCGIGFQGNYQNELRRCVFTHCNTALIGASRNPLVLYECRFADNKWNWALPYRHLVAIDCTVDSYDKGVYSADRGTFFIAKRHVVVRVLDEAGKPVRRAEVRVVAPEQPPAAEFDNWCAVTGADGRTPTPGAKRALLLSEVLIRAAKQEGGQPTHTTYRYTVTARAKKRSARLEGFAPGQAQTQVELRLAP